MDARRVIPATHRDHSVQRCLFTAAGGEGTGSFIGMDPHGCAWPTARSSASTEHQGPDLAIGAARVQTLQAIMRACTATKPLGADPRIASGDSSAVTFQHTRS
jgi:hypothetical protein